LEFEHWNFPSLTEHWNLNIGIYLGGDFAQNTTKNLDLYFGAVFCLCSAVFAAAKNPSSRGISLYFD